MLRDYSECFVDADKHLTQAGIEMNDGKYEIAKGYILEAIADLREAHAWINNTLEKKND